MLQAGRETSGGSRRRMRRRSVTRQRKERLLGKLEIGDAQLNKTVMFENLAAFAADFCSRLICEPAFLRSTSTSHLIPIQLSTKFLGL